jgi:hypothetical protein
MSKARDIANILSANTAIATDAEVATGISAERSAVATLTNKVIDGNLNTFHVMRGTTANIPSTGTFGDQYFNTTDNSLYNYTQTGWKKVSLDPPPGVSSISPTAAPANGTVITITGSGFKAGAVVQFVGTDAIAINSPTVVFISDNTITATTQGLSVTNEPYDVKVINNDNQFSILENCLDAGGTPTWNTSSGTIASVYMGSSLSVSVSATDPDGTSIVYSSLNLPAWVSLNSSTGALTGTVPTSASSTTYSFNITASDGINSSSRAFNLVSLATNYFGNSSDGVGSY